MQKPVIKLPLLLNSSNKRTLGSRVRLSKERLRADYLIDGTSCSYVRVTVNGQLAGNAFACRWISNYKRVCWVTQLVVHRNYRERGLAVGLLNEIRQDGDDVYGLMSSHPAACLAVAKAFGSQSNITKTAHSVLTSVGSINTIRIDFIKEWAESIMKASPINYVRDAKLKGRLFAPDDTSGLVSSVDSGFFVDHEEPLEALAWVRESLNWPLGELLDGYEFLVLLEARRRPCFNSRIIEE